ncbi:hypothetical protein [Terriglobus roseus]|uniref:Uncharacterized protein n=1 Tax=Terriglobus roseus TaxID=392734 RepID=A0A1H4MW38_9BACT|nr:hypothetical protein [Terriglobus roseus]SEB87390.1 hypothetical protein SAMN05443244_2063 [Terriglobus roseus]
MLSDLGKAARRGTDAMVRCVGASTAILRMPAPPVAGDAGEELGLRSPEFQRLILTPVAVQPKGNGIEVLAPAAALETLLGISGAGAIAMAMRSVATVLLGDEAYVLMATHAVVSMGQVCLYRLVLQMPPTEVV